jgi:DNA modification methylase
MATQAQRRRKGGGLSEITWTLQTVDVASLTDYFKNPRSLSKEQFAQLKTSLDKFGMIDKPIINLDAAHTVIGGHQRLHVIRSEGIKQVEAWIPSRELDGREVEELNIRLNKNTGAWDFDVLANAWDVPDLLEWGFSEKELQLGGFDLDQPEGEDPGAQIDKAEELRVKWGVESGQLWKLGEHRLICGDCTDRAVVDQVMQGDKAEMVWTDPPYGVAVGDKNKYLNAIAPSNRVEENLVNDTLDEPGLIKMLCKSFDLAIEHCTAGAAWYVAAPPGPLHVVFGQVLKDRGIWRQTIQWVKNNSTFSPMGVCYHWQAEPIFFGWLPSAGHRWYGGRTQTTVWNIDRPMKSPEHPTMKPVELVVRAVQNSSKQGEVVYEPFSGSGTTICACEQLGRLARAVEISPAYCAVTIQRWVDMTQGTPELMDTTQ